MNRKARAKAKQLSDRGYKSIQHRRKRGSFYTNKTSHRENGGGQKSHRRRNQEGQLQLYARPENTI